MQVKQSVSLKYSTTSQEAVNPNPLCNVKSTLMMGMPANGNANDYDDNDDDDDDGENGFDGSLW